MKGKQAGGKGETTTYRTKDFHIPVWVRMCSFSVLKRVNIFSHSPHLYGLSSLCTGMWTLRSVDRAKRLPHSLHSNGFSPETKKQKKAFYKNTNNMWYELSYTEPRPIFILFLKAVNSRQNNLTIPECTMAWRLNVIVDMNSLPQSSHRNGFTPVCRPMWDCSSSWVRNVLSHSSHLKGLSPVCTACTNKRSRPCQCYSSLQSYQ